MTEPTPAAVPAIERTLELDAAPEAVWRAITDPAEIAGWFGDSAELTAEVGAEGYFGWKSHGRFAVRVEEVDPPRRFVWRWARRPDRPLDAGLSTLVEWTLTPKPGGGTTLHLRESGFVAPEAREENVAGWTSELAELVEFLDER